MQVESRYLFAEFQFCSLASLRYEFYAKNSRVHRYSRPCYPQSSGCTLRLFRLYDKVLARVMVRSLGIDSSAIRGNLEEHYIQTILEMVRTSSIEKIALLAHEHTYDDNNQKLPDFCSIYVPNDYVLDLAKKHPEFLAGVSIHPGRPDAFDELARCIEHGAVLMKCLPNVQNIDCSDLRYKNFWTAMADAKLPLLAHTGGELSLPQYNPKLADPKLLRLPLECGVKVIAAHCGTSSLYHDPDYVADWVAMLAEYPNLYGDNSGLQTPIRSRHLKKLIAPNLSKRILYGSDVPIPISARWAWLRGMIDGVTYRRIAAIKNPLERDVQVKLAMGFTEESFTLANSILLL